MKGLPIESFMRHMSAILLVSTLILAHCGCSQSSDPEKELIIGKWEALEGQKKVTIEFTKQGKVNLGGNPSPLAFAFKFVRVLSDFNVKAGSVPITYQLTKDKRLEVEADLSKVVQALGGDAKNAKARESVKAAVSENELTITNDQGESLTLKRSK